MRFYHVSKHGWIVNSFMRLLRRSNRAVLTLTNSFTRVVGGCVLCARPTSSSAVVSPRICETCERSMHHHILEVPNAHRCVQCAHLLTTDDLHCLECLTEPPVFTHSTVFADYVEQLQHMLLAYKFHNALHFAPALADCLRHALVAYSHHHTPDIIVLVPSLDTRIQQMGFSHLRLLMSSIDLTQIWPERTPIYAPDALVRLHHDRLQVNVKPDMRRKQVKNAFAVAQKSLIKGAHVLLIDDIITTGATLNEVAAQLNFSGASQVDNVLIARTRRTPLK